MRTNSRDLRLTALRRFAAAITILNLLGHTILGFEQAWAHPLVALIVAYALELLLGGVDSWARNERPVFAGSLRNLFHFLLPAHITALACAMLLYPGDRLGPVVFAVTVAVASKHVFRATVRGRRRHFFNPSNAGITATLLAFPSVAIAQPYMFTENLVGWQDWLLPAVIIISGSILNAKLTRRIPLILAWSGGFVLQAVIRSLVLDAPLVACLLPMTGVAYLLFTFYMVTDPATTPFEPRRQVVFGLAVAGVYGVLMSVHVVFTIFFALTIVCFVRGVHHWLAAWLAGRQAVPALVAAGKSG